LFPVTLDISKTFPALKLKIGFKWNKHLLQSLAIFAKIGSPEADKAKKLISLCREKMPEEQFKVILKEFEFEFE